MKKKQKTSTIKKQLAQLAAAYLAGEINLETFIQETLKRGREVWEAIKFETLKRFGGYLTEEDIEATIIEAVTIACMKCNNAEKFFAYTRQTLKGMLKRLAASLAFANVVSKPNTALEKVSLESLFSEEDEEGNHSPADIIEPSCLIDNAVQDEFFLLELRDFVMKKLPPLHQSVFWAAFEGDSVEEIAKELNIPPQQVVEVVQEIRKVLKEFVS